MIFKTKGNVLLFCFFFSPIGWSGSGCQVKWMSNDKTECSCNHLTHFAVLMQFDSTSAGRSKIRITKVRHS